MFTQMLCATDVSDNGNRALDYAARIAGEEGAELHIVHVVERLATGRAAGQLARVDEPERYDELKQRASEISARGIKKPCRSRMPTSAATRTACPTLPERTMLI